MTGSIASHRRAMRRSTPIKQRLEAMTDRSGGPNACWPFTGARNVDGYGNIWHGGRSRGAHVVALILATGEDRGPDMFAIHSCDNPPCCNPAHLRWGTPSDNMRDMYGRGRHTKRGHKLTDADVIAIRSREGQTLKALAAEFGVSFALIHQIRKGRVWRHLLPTDTTER